MMYFLTILTGFIPSAYANTTKLDTFGAGAAGHTKMWNKIRGTVHVDITATDIVHALTGGIVQFIFTFIAGASTVLIIYAGVRMIASRGKEDEYSQGKTIITWAIIGLVLSLVARAIVIFFEEGFLPAFLN